MWQNLLDVLLGAGFWVGGMLAGAWILSLRRRDVSVADVFWGLGFAVVALYAFRVADGYIVRRAAVTALTVVWGVRLSLYIARRRIGEQEDRRYAAIRARVGPAWPLLSLPAVFASQGLAVLFFGLPVTWAQLSVAPGRTTWIDLLATLVWAIGFTFEALGDSQLRRFRADPDNRGRVLDTGLWRYTRHPNYFGDALVFWGLFGFAVATPGGWWTIVSPIALTLMLLRITGVPLLEEDMEQRRPGYADYVRRTNAFFPGPPRRS